MIKGHVIVGLFYRIIEISQCLVLSRVRQMFLTFCNHQGFKNGLVGQISELCN